ncbi:hypothetical protein BDZ89DRAFT_1064517 [Hymenopellis radicata]|nr:hypothetical protein BDZ89DRAFT_1064517 [Hymenopellis radicata]
MQPGCPTPEESPPNEADTANVRISLESFGDKDAPEPPQTASRTRRKPTVQPDKHFFGIKQDAPPPGFVFNDDYDTRFPDDPYCKETSAPNAKVWRVYVEEAAAFDANMIGRYRDGLDVMLVFAGLFSAVVTSFLVQASQNLQADYGEMTAMLLHDLVAIQLSLADGASVVNITSPSANPTGAFVANRIDVLVNGFWVVSLSASLAVALAAVLVKQWLHHYTSLLSGTSRHRSHVRHSRFTGLERWRVRVIIGTLPIIMHLSLMLFLSGLILFFVPLHVSLAWAVGVITVILCTLYFISNALPIFYPQCLAYCAEGR